MEVLWPLKSREAYQNVAGSGLRERGGEGVTVGYAWTSNSEELILQQDCCTTGKTDPLFVSESADIRTELCKT